MQCRFKTRPTRCSSLSEFLLQRLLAFGYGGGERERLVPPLSSGPPRTEPLCPAWRWGSARIATASCTVATVVRSLGAGGAQRCSQAWLGRLNSRPGSWWPCFCCRPLPPSPRASWLPACVVTLSPLLASACPWGVVRSLWGAVAHRTPRRSLCPFVATTLEQGTGSRGKPEVRFLKSCI